MQATSSLSVVAGNVGRMATQHLELTDQHRAMLEFEHTWWKHAGAKEQRIRELFDMSSARYYQALNVVIDQPAALEHDPMTVNRLRRLRAQRQAGRRARAAGLGG